MFRLFSGLVPKDEEESNVLGEEEAHLYRFVLRTLLDILKEDHLSGLKGAAFWTHFSRPDCIKLPMVYMEKVVDRLVAATKATVKQVDQGQTRTQRAMLAKRERDFTRMVKCCEDTLADHAKGTLLERPDIGEGNGSMSKIYEYGNVDIGSKPRTQKDPSAKKPMNPRVCIDSFLFRAIEHWIRHEKLDDDKLHASYRSWDANGDGKLQLDEFAFMIKFANPSAGQKRIIRAFLAASGSTEGDEDDSVVIERLLPALQFYDLQLKDQPPGWAPPVASSVDNANDGGAGNDEEDDDSALPGANDGRTTKAKVMSGMHKLGQLTSVLRTMGGNDLESVKEEDLPD